VLKNAKSGRKRRSVTWRRITGPHVFCMMAQERSPALPSRLCGAHIPHLLLKSSFPHPNIQLEQLATNALSSQDGGCLLPSPSSKESSRTKASAFSHAPLICACRTHRRAHAALARSVVFLDKEERLFPGSDHPGAARTRRSRSLFL
jgi:hypothetical protein